MDEVKEISKIKNKGLKNAYNDFLDKIGQQEKIASDLERLEKSISPAKSRENISELRENSIPRDTTDTNGIDRSPFMSSKKNKTPKKSVPLINFESNVGLESGENICLDSAQKTSYSDIFRKSKTKIQENNQKLKEEIKQENKFNTDVNLEANLNGDISDVLL